MDNSTGTPRCRVAISTAGRPRLNLSDAERDQAEGAKIGHDLIPGNDVERIDVRAADDTVARLQRFAVFREDVGDMGDDLGEVVRLAARQTATDRRSIELHRREPLRDQPRSGCEREFAAEEHTVMEDVTGEQRIERRKRFRRVYKLDGWRHRRDGCPRIIQIRPGRDIGSEPHGDFGFDARLRARRRPVWPSLREDAPAIKPADKRCTEAQALLGGRIVDPDLPTDPGHSGFKGAAEGGELASHAGCDEWAGRFRLTHGQGFYVALSRGGSPGGDWKRDTCRRSWGRPGGNS